MFKIKGFKMNMNNVISKEQKVNPATEKKTLLITLKEAAEYLGVCERTVRRLSALGKLPPMIKVGHSVRMNYSAIIEFTKKGCFYGF